ncbi:hypothetical protein A3844_01765 [Paenibacillus helianthi]|uniref:ASCH domain-containing protein n=1 Tax=Paenibacillus helianthi TaxID=1349432 RepID=A0ABX3EWX7_9BACL|nr:hypothetical protein [Paenibacillus helianthi]OKP91866.1 hypothetical protein A3844_01765 [Paenibacillus helianthi]
MKAITIIQPWPTKHRGELAIHAGMKIDKAACEESEIKAALARYDHTADTLPTGAVVAISRLVDCQEIHIAHTGDATLLTGFVPTFLIDQASKEFTFGWYGNGRYAWELADVKQLPELILAKGQQGLWNWTKISNSR